MQRLGGRVVCDSCQTPYKGLEPGTKCEKCGGTLVRRKDDEPERFATASRCTTGRPRRCIDWVTRNARWRLVMIDAVRRARCRSRAARSKALTRSDPAQVPREIEIMARGGKILADTRGTDGAPVQAGHDDSELDTIAEDFIRSHKGAVPSFKGLYGFPGQHLQLDQQRDRPRDPFEEARAE